MHDPLTVAFDIDNPLTPKRKSGFRGTLLTIWHKDPETNGSDNSCGWTYPPLSKEELEWCEDMINNPTDNIQSFFNKAQDKDEMVWRVAQIVRCYKRISRPWYRHPKWHFWHWRIQIHPVLHFKRWAFSRCKYCGKRFKWGESPTGYWGSKGPQWFKSEDAWHRGCDQ